MTMIGIRMVDAFGSSSHNLALPVYSDSADRTDPTAFAGWFLATWAVGNIIVQQAIRVYGNHRGRNVGVPGFVAGTVLMSSAFIVCFAGFPVFLTMLIALVAGMADGLTEVSYVNHLQMLPGRARDRAFGLSAMAENLGFGFGMILCSFLLERYTPFAVVAVSHSVPILLSLLFCVSFAGKAKRTGGGTIEYMAAPHSNHRDGAEVSGR
jgi:MFS family permease